MHCPKQEALTRCEMVVAEGTYLLRQAGKDQKSVESFVESLLYIHQYIKDRPCAGEYGGD